MPDQKSEESVEKTEEKEAETEKVEAVVDEDYQKELEEATAKVKANEEARKGYAQRHQEVSQETEVIDEEKEDKLADKVVQKLTPIIQQTVESSNFDKRLSELSGGNPALAQLIKLHYDKSTNPNLPLEDRLEFAYAIANKKVIAKKVSEINIAQKNRQQIVNVGQGNSTETQQIPGSNSLSTLQKEELKKRADQLGRAAGWNEIQKKKFIDDAEKRLMMSK
jgi:hypothetical protein